MAPNGHSGFCALLFVCVIGFSLAQVHGKVCSGTGSNFLTAQSLPSFADCDVIDGNLKMVPTTFSGNKYYNIPPLHPASLTVLKHVREIRGYLLIQSDHEDFTDLSFLSSLEVIYGQELTKDQHALQILNTPLKTLELVALRRIANGDVFIVANHQLCYADSVNWTLLFDTERQTTLVKGNKQTTSCGKNAV